MMTPGMNEMTPGMSEESTGIAMQRFVVSTDDVVERDRFSYWRETLGEAMTGIVSEPNYERDIPFESSAVSWIGRSMHRYRYRGSPHPVLRREREIARHSWDDRIWVYREFGEGCLFRNGRREIVTRPGDLVISDPTIPFEGDARRGYDSDRWSFPRALIDPHLAAAQRPLSLHLSDHSGVNGLVLSYLDALGGQLDSLGDGEAHLVADNLCRLLAVACGGEAGEQGGAIASARLEEARRYVGLHLADPALTPEKAAAALKLSVRQLHRLFEPSGASFAQYVLSRRLEECRSALASASGAGRSVTDIALGWGFNSLQTFYRTFQRAYGAAPNDLRAAAIPSPRLRGEG